MSRWIYLLKKLEGRLARWCGWEVPLDENGHIRHRKSRRDMVETVVDIRKEAADPGRSGK